MNSKYFQIIFIIKILLNKILIHWNAYLENFLNMVLNEVDYDL